MEYCSSCATLKIIMKQYVKFIVIGLIVIGSIFLLLYFVGANFISNISPKLETVPDKVESKTAIIGKDAPYFNLMSLEGSYINSVDLSDRPTVITFWATWNSESIDQIKIFDDYLASLKDTSLESSPRILAIDSQEAKSTVENVIRRGGYKLEVLVDQKGETSTLYGIKTLPTTFFINREGKIIEIYTGTLSKSMIVDKIENILR